MAPRERASEPVYVCVFVCFKSLIFISLNSIKKQFYFLIDIEQQQQKTIIVID